MWQLWKSIFKSLFSLGFSFSFSFSSLFHTECCGICCVEWFCSSWGSSECFSLFINEINYFSAALIWLWDLCSSFGKHFPSALGHHAMMKHISSPPQSTCQGMLLLLLLAVAGTSAGEFQLSGLLLLPWKLSLMFCTMDWVHCMEMEHGISVSLPITSGNI